MVHLVLSSTKGNQGQRFFPHTGYLGLTPIRVEGIVRTKLDADGKRLPAKSISVAVRCYETRVGRVGAVQSSLLVDCTHTLWAAAPAADYEPIGALEFPFRLSIPARVAGFSTAAFVDYRCVWRIEAVLHHAPIVGVGSRQVRHYELPLVRYDLPPPWPLVPPQQQETTKPRAPRIRYSIHPPTTPIGPQDLVSIPIHLQPLDHAVAIRSASVIVERRIVLHDIAALPHQPPPPPTDPTDYLELASEPASSSSSLPTVTPNSIFPSSESTPLLPTPPTPASAKVIVNPIAGVESSGSFARDARGIWSKTLTLQWPAPKSHSRWAIGESITSELVSVKYFVRTKIIVTSPAGTESLELADHELQIVSTNAAERQLALAKYTEALDADAAAAPTTRSKSKSPRRARAEAPRDVPPSPWSPAAAHSRPITKARRPHTSAGPRDRPVDFGGAAYGSGVPAVPSVSPSTSPSGGGSSSGTTSDGGRRAARLLRPDTAGGSGPVSGRNSASFWSTVHSNGISGARRGGAGGGASSASTSTSTSGSVSSMSGRSTKSSKSGKSTSGMSASGSGTNGESGSAAGEAHMREWEEELARIEVRSRRSSDLLGFAGKVRRVLAGATVARGAVPVPTIGVGVGGES